MKLRKELAQTNKETWQRSTVQFRTIAEGLNKTM